LRLLAVVTAFVGDQRLKTLRRSAESVHIPRKEVPTRSKSVQYRAGCGAVADASLLADLVLELDRQWRSPTWCSSLLPREVADSSEFEIRFHTAADANAFRSAPTSGPTSARQHETLETPRDG
jgi:hypothetical protein